MGRLNNKDFNVIEFDTFKNEAGSNRFILSPTKWIKTTNAIGMTSKAGRYNGGTYAHVDIALEFATWLSPEFKLYLITEFQKLKKDEALRNNEVENWNIYRELSKMNYKIHTDAIKNNLISEIDERDKKFTYSTEADMINKIVFGIRARDFKNQCQELFNKDKNLRDIASKQALQLIANLESANAQLLNKKIISAKIRIEELQKQCENEKKSLKILHNYHLCKVSEGIYDDDLLGYKFFQNIKSDFENLMQKQNKTISKKNAR